MRYINVRFTYLLTFLTYLLILASLFRKIPEQNKPQITQFSALPIWYRPTMYTLPLRQILSTLPRLCYRLANHLRSPTSDPTVYLLLACLSVYSNVVSNWKYVGLQLKKLM